MLKEGPMRAFSFVRVDSREGIRHGRRMGSGPHTYLLADSSDGTALRRGPRLPVA